MSGCGTAVLKSSETMFRSRHTKHGFFPSYLLKYEDKTLVVQVPSQFFYEFLEDKFVDLLRKTLYKVIGEGTKLMYNVMVDKSSRKTVDLESTQRTIIPQKQVMDKRIPQIPVPELDPHLNPEYNFETFNSKVTATSCRAALQKLSLSIRLKQSSIRCSYTEHQV